MHVREQLCAVVAQSSSVVANSFREFVQYRRPSLYQKRRDRLGGDMDV